jgi:AraC family transcriptional regulator
MVDDPGVTPHLAHGRFFGDFEGRRDLGGAVLASLVPRVPEREVARHTHEDAHFVFVTAGTYISSASGAPEVAAAPTFVYNPPGTTHRDRFASAHGRFFTISLNRERLAELQAPTPLPGRPVWLGHPAALGAVTRLRLECDRWDDASPLAAEALLWTLVEATANVRAPRPDRVLDRAPWLDRVRERLHDECARPLRLDALAAEAGVHPGHLTRGFRQAFGCTPGAYQRLCRVQRATGLLRRTRAPLAEIADQCGFSDQSHLTRAVRTHLGLTPARLRR